jgi:hypothetical protein
MQRLLFTTATLLLGANACLAQVSTMGTTSMGLPSTPGTIVSSPLNGPSPFSAVTQSGAPDTTLAPVPLALDPTTPGTVVTCSPPSGQLAPSTPAVPVTSMSATGGTTGTMPSMPASPGTIPPSMTASPLTMMPSTTATMGAVSTSVSGSTTGTISPISPLGSSSTATCSSTPGGPPTNGAALPLSTPEIPTNPPPGTIQPGITDPGSTSINPTMTVVPTPNASTCTESMTMNLANPGMMAPANATGATATPGVSPPPGC